MRPDTAAPLILLAATLLAGCTTPGSADPQRIQIDLEPQPVPADGTLWVNLTLRNPTEQTLRFTSSDSCVRWLVFVRANETPIFLDRMGLDPDSCTGGPTRHALAPGDSLEATFRLHLFAYRQAGAPVFSAGGYTVVADLQAEQPTWEVQAEKTFSVGSALTLARIQIAVADEPIQRGEPVEITANFTNDSDRWYNYTAPDGCAFLLVWVDTEEGRVELRREGEPDVCTLALQEVAIPPGGSRERTVTWDGATQWGGDEHVEPGTYTLRADFDTAAEGEGPWDASGSRNLEVS